jgi:hypothetical protein
MKINESIFLRLHHPPGLTASGVIEKRFRGSVSEIAIAVHHPIRWRSGF